MDDADRESIEQFRVRVRERWSRLSTADVDLLCVRRADVRSQFGPRFRERVAEARRAVAALRRDDPPSALEVPR